ncbi:MAG: hypothetical protein V3S36_02795 [Acidiferrobacterales bacterium]
MRNQRRRYDQVDLSLTHNLIGDVQAVAIGVLRFGQIHEKR